MNIALKIDVHTYRGTRNAVPVLIDLLRQQGAGASFLFTLGPDSSGRLLRRALRQCVMRRRRPPSLLSHYGWRSLLSGLFVPSPEIGRRCADVIRAVQAAGFETGVRCFDEAQWLLRLDEADGAWTRRQMERARDRYREIFGKHPRLHAAAGWRINRHALRLSQQMGFDFCSDTRGTRPFVPLYQAELVVCPQLPTTLPGLDELLDRGMSADQAVDHVLEASERALPSGHVYNAHAEIEGGRRARQFERLLEAWQGRNVKLSSLSDYFEALPDKDLPRHTVIRERLPGSHLEIATQGEEFLA